MTNHRTENFKSIYKRMSAMLLLAAFLAGFIYIWFERFNTMRREAFVGKGNLLVLAVYAVIMFIVFTALGAFKIGVNKALHVILAQVIATVVVNLLMAGQITLIVGDIWHMKQVLSAIGLLTVYDIAACIVLTNLCTGIYYRLFPPYEILMINGEHGNALKDKIGTRSDKYKITEEISIDEGEERIKERILAYDVVLLNDLPNQEMMELIKLCFQNSKRCYFTPKLANIISKASDEVDLFDTLLYLNKNFGLSLEQRFAKRVLDIAVSLLAIVITSPVMLVTALVIKLTDFGPVFFFQERVTKDGKHFRMCKFRSMRVDAENDGKPHPAQDDDDRITPIGRFIRPTRIDELPQFFNILFGDMSVVGPRPERVENVELYTKQIPEFSYRMKVKGGLTGYAQVFGKYNTSAYDKLKLDLNYIVNYSFFQDLRIILMTLRVIFIKEATDGFSEEQAAQFTEEEENSKTMR